MDELQIAPSVGTKEDAYDNAMAEAWVASYKTELTDWLGLTSYERSEHETVAWISFYNHNRLHEALGDIPPAEFEALNGLESDREHPTHDPAPPKTGLRRLGAAGPNRIEIESNTLTATP